MNMGRRAIQVSLVSSALLLQAALMVSTPAAQAGAPSALTQGKTCLAHGQVKAAIKELEQAVKETPNSCEAHLCLGQAYVKAKVFPRARDQFRSAIRVGKGSPNAQKANACLMNLPRNLIAPRTGPQTRIISANLGLTSRERGAEGSRPTVIDFYAAWCQPCKQLQPALSRMKGEFSDKVNFVSVNVDDPGSQSVVDQYGVSPIPTLVFLNPEGEVVTYAIGYSGESALTSGIKKILAGS